MSEAEEDTLDSSNALTSVPLVDEGVLSSLPPKLAVDRLCVIVFAILCDVRFLLCFSFRTIRSEGRMLFSVKLSVLPPRADWITMLSIKEISISFWRLV